MKLWLDEARPAPDASWTVCRTVEEAEDLLALTDYPFSACSLDHDLSTAAIFEAAPSGLDFVHWMIRHRVVPFGYVEVHSQNPIGGGRMVYALWRAGYKVRWRPYGGFFGFIPFDRTLG